MKFYKIGLFTHTHWYFVSLDPQEILLYRVVFVIWFDNFDFSSDPFFFGKVCERSVDLKNTRENGWDFDKLQQLQQLLQHFDTTKADFKS